MRVTLGMITDGVRANLMQNAQQLMEAQDRASSGKRIQRPSDDVPGTGRAIRMRSALTSIDQLERNSNVASNLLSVTENRLTSIIKSLQDVRSLAVQAGNGALPPAALQGIAEQLGQVTVELQGVANTQYLGRYIFSGSLSNTQAITANPGVPVTYAFQGDNTDFNIQIAPGAHIVANVTGDTVFNIGGVANAAIPDLFTSIETLKANVLAGNTTAISAQIADIDAHLGNVSAIRSQIGGRIDRLEASDQGLQDSKLKITDLLSKTEDADTAEAIIDLQTRQNVYQAAIAAASRILDLSLVNMWK